MVDSGSAPGRIRVAIADDDLLTRASLRQLLDDDHRYVVIGEVGDGRKAVELAIMEKPDLFLIDRSMPLLDGIATVSRVQAASPLTAVVLYSVFREAGTYQAVVGSGALAVLDDAMLDGTFAERLAATLLDRVTGEQTELDIEVGPVRSSAAIVWIDNALPLLGAVRRRQDVLAAPIAEEVWDTFDRLLRAWREVAEAGPEFYWTGRTTVADVTAILEAGAAISALSDETLRSLDTHRAGPTGTVFLHALQDGILRALRRHGSATALANLLATSWGPRHSR